MESSRSRSILSLVCVGLQNTKNWTYSIEKWTVGWHNLELNIKQTHQSPKLLKPSKHFSLNRFVTLLCSCRKTLLANPLSKWLRVINFEQRRVLLGRRLRSANDWNPTSGRTFSLSPRFWLHNETCKNEKMKQFGDTNQTLKQLYLIL